ncbi:MAG TPA: hypothetical protein VFE01_03085, partial [Terracidiphilus sp.]|nr:hypothetical protein [Terracidiphilus sp.]
SSSQATNPAANATERKHPLKRKAAACFRIHQCGRWLDRELEMAHTLVSRIAYRTELGKGSGMGEDAIWILASR